MVNNCICTIFKVQFLINIPAWVAFCKCKKWVGKLVKIHWKTATIGLENIQNISKILQRYMKNPIKIKLKNFVITAFLSYFNCIRNLEKSATIKLEITQVLSVILRDSSGSLHTLCHCKKCIESTVRTRTHVKPVFFTLNIFAVQSGIFAPRPKISTAVQSILV